MTYPAQQQGWPQQPPQQGQPFAPTAGATPQNFAQYAPQNTAGAMTAPQFQQYPNGAGAQPQNYGGQPAAPAATMPSWDNAEDPSGFGGLFARPRHLVGRVVIYIPKRVDNNAKGMDGNAKATPNVHGDLIVVDGPSPLLFGDKLKQGGVVERPNTHSVTVPAFFANVIVGEQEVAKALARAVPPMGNGLMVGVITRGTQGNNPFLLQTLEMNDPRRAFARQVYEAYANKTWTPPEFVEIAPTPGSAYNAQAQPPQTPGPQPQQWSQPQGMGGQVTQWGPQPGQMPASAPPAVNPAQWMQPQGGAPQAPAQQAAPATDDASLPVAPNWDPNQWAALPSVNKRQVWDAINAMNQQAPQPGNMAGPTGF